MTKTLADEALESFLLADKVAVVTGGASGLGRSIANLFAAAGAKLAVLDINETGAAEVAAGIRAKGGAACAVRCDLARERQIVQALDAAERELGTIDILVNCAAYRKKAEFMEMSESEWDQMFAITLRGAFYAMRSTIRRMIGNGIAGSIVNISSIGGQRPTIFANAHYEAAKAGLDALTRAAAVEFAPHKIRINGVAPGSIRTEGFNSIQKSVGLRGPAAIPGRKLLGIAEPLEIARAVLFVASPSASHMTGQTLSVDGGFLVG